VRCRDVHLIPKLSTDEFWRIPNFWNVVSNIPFIAIGAAGLWRFRDGPATIILFLGFFLTGVGSSYYHWHPNDATLFWDRLPMTLSFASLTRDQTAALAEVSRRRSCAIPRPPGSAVTSVRSARSAMAFSTAAAISGFLFTSWSAAFWSRVRREKSR
jgi:hypothetical protein